MVRGEPSQEAEVWAAESVAIAQVVGPRRQVLMAASAKPRETLAATATAAKQTGGFRASAVWLLSKSAAGGWSTDKAHPRSQIGMVRTSLAGGFITEACGIDEGLYPGVDRPGEVGNGGPSVMEAWKWEQRSPRPSCVVEGADYFLSSSKRRAWAFVSSTVVDCMESVRVRPKCKK